VTVQLPPAAWRPPTVVAQIWQRVPGGMPLTLASSSVPHGCGAYRTAARAPGRRVQPPAAHHPGAAGGGGGPGCGTRVAHPAAAAAASYGGVLREAAVSLEELRGKDEPVFTGAAGFTVGSLEMALGRYDDALRHLREARDLADRVGGDWLAAGARVQLGILAVLRGRLDEARALLDEGLDLSLAARSTPVVTLCLAGYAQLAFADGDPDRAALLEGAAEGLRRRVGLPAWPHLRRVEADLVARVRHRLGGSRFDQVFSAGSGLTQRDAVAVVRDQRGTDTHRP